MKKCLIVMLATASVCFAQSRIVEKHGAMMAEGRPFIANGSIYNSYDLANSPLGLFEVDSARLSAEVGYGYWGLRDFSRHDLSGQSLRMGDPGRAFFKVFYGPDFLSYNGGQYAGASVSPLQRFGLTLAGQTENGFFGGALSGDGYIGTQTWENGDSTRWLAGFDRLRIDLRSQVHPLARVGVFVNAALHVDTLSAMPHEDRSAHVNLPELGGNVDFGGEGTLVQSNLSVSYASSRFVYVSKGTGGSVGVDGGGNANTIINDSIQLFWIAQSEFPINDDYAVTPGFIMGWSNNTGNMFQPHIESDPFKPGPKIPELWYSLTGLYFGIGSGFKALQYADAHLEYMATIWSLDYEQQPVSRTLHHISLGVSSGLHKYIEMPLKVTPRIAYFISGATGGYYGLRYPNMEPLNIYPGQSKSYLYPPQRFLDGFERISGFTFGVDGLALEDKLSASLWMTFLSSKNDIDSKGGMELGLSVGFSM